MTATTTMTTRTLTKAATILLMTHQQLLQWQWQHQRILDYLDNPTRVHSNSTWASKTKNNGRGGFQSIGFVKTSFSQDSSKSCQVSIQRCVAKTRRHSVAATSGLSDIFQTTLVSCHIFSRTLLYIQQKWILIPKIMLSKVLVIRW